MPTLRWGKGEGVSKILAFQDKDMLGKQSQHRTEPQQLVPAAFSAPNCQGSGGWSKRRSLDSTSSLRGTWIMEGYFSAKIQRWDAPLSPPPPPSGPAEQKAKDGEAKKTGTGEEMVASHRPMRANKGHESRSRS